MPAQQQQREIHWSLGHDDPMYARLLAESCIRMPVPLLYRVPNSQTVLVGAAKVYRCQQSGPTLMDKHSQLFGNHDFPPLILDSRSSPTRPVDDDEYQAEDKADGRARGPKSIAPASDHSCPTTFVDVLIKVIRGECSGIVPTLIRIFDPVAV